MQGPLVFNGDVQTETPQQNRVEPRDGAASVRKDIAEGTCTCDTNLDARHFRCCFNSNVLTRASPHHFLDTLTLCSALGIATGS